MIAADGYVRFYVPYREKFYRAQVTDGQRVRILKTKFRTVSGALAYGQRVALRFNRVSLMVQAPDPVEV